MSLGRRNSNQADLYNGNVGSIPTTYKKEFSMKFGSSINYHVKKDYRKNIRSYHRRQLHKIVKGNTEVIFETSKNRFSDRWDWD